MSRFPVEILDLRQFRDQKNSQEIGCSFAVIGCSVNKIGYGSTMRAGDNIEIASSLSIS